MDISPKEEFLIASCLEGGREAFGELAEFYGKPVWGFMKSLLGDRAEGYRSDFIDCFAEALRGQRPHDQSESYLAAVFCLLLPRIREAAPLVGEVLQGNPFASAGRVRTILEILTALPWESRVMLLLREQLDLSHAEISVIMRISVKEVKQALEKSQVAFREQLDAALRKRAEGPR